MRFGLRLGRLSRTMAARTPHYRLAGLEPMGGKSRRWRDVRTGETLSYNAGRRHPKPRGPALSTKPKPIEDGRLQLALRVMRRESSLPAAAGAARG